MRACLSIAAGLLLPILAAYAGDARPRTLPSHPATMDGQSMFSETFKLRADPANKSDAKARAQLTAKTARRQEAEAKAWTLREFARLALILAALLLAAGTGRPTRLRSA